jgi:hypothetical protein
MSTSVDENHAPSSHANTQANPLFFQERSSLEISLQLGQLDSLNLIFESIFEIKLEYLKKQIYVMRIYFLLSFSFEFRNRFRMPSFIRRNKGTNTIEKHHNHHSQVILEEKKEPSFNQTFQRDVTQKNLVHGLQPKKHTKTF